MNKRWSQEEVRSLIDYTESGKHRNYRKFSEKNNRTYKAVMKKAGQLNLSLKEHWWSEDDVDYLIYYVISEDTRDYKAAAEFLGKTVCAVQAKVNRLRKNEDVAYLNKPFTQKEDDLIRKYYKDKTDVQIGLYLKRSTSSIQGRRIVLGLIRKKRPVINLKLKTKHPWVIDEEVRRAGVKNGFERNQQRRSYKSICGR